MNSTSCSKWRDSGLLILRIGLGIAFMVHGWPKLMGGPRFWEGLGGAVYNWGVAIGCGSGVANGAA